MLRWSQQQRIVNDLAISFQNLKNTHTKITHSVIDKDKVHLNPKKFETYTSGNFKFIVLWTVFKMNTPKTETLKMMTRFEQQDIKNVMKEKERILLFQNTFLSDTTFMQSKIITPGNVIGLYKKEQISLLYVWWFFNKETHKLSRLQQRLIDRINFFMDYFPPIKEYLLST